MIVDQESSVYTFHKHRAFFNPTMCMTNLNNFTLHVQQLDPFNAILIFNVRTVRNNTTSHKIDYITWFSNSKSATIYSFEQKLWRFF